VRCAPSSGPPVGWARPCRAAGPGPGRRGGRHRRFAVGRGRTRWPTCARWAPTTSSTTRPQGRRRRGLLRDHGRAGRRRDRRPGAGRRRRRDPAGACRVGGRPRCCAGHAGGLQPHDPPLLHPQPHAGRAWTLGGYPVEEMRRINLETQAGARRAGRVGPLTRPNPHRGRRLRRRPPRPLADLAGRRNRRASGPSAARRRRSPEVRAWQVSKAGEPTEGAGAGRPSRYPEPGTRTRCGLKVHAAAARPPRRLHVPHDLPADARLAVRARPGGVGDGRRPSAPRSPAGVAVGEPGSWPRPAS